MKRCVSSQRLKRFFLKLQQMTIVMRPSCWHKNFGPNGLSAPTQGLCLNFFSSITTDFNISSALRWAIQDQWSSGFSIFQVPVFVYRTYRTYIHQCPDLVSGLKHAIGPYCGIVWVLFSMKICTKSRNLGWKQRTFQQNQRFFGTRNWETNASQVRMSFAQLHHDVMNI